jgi:ABC-type phosphate transport system substrate-binding protein
MQRRHGLAVAVLLLVLQLVHPRAVHAEELLSAAGSTFAYPLYSKWFKAYARESGRPGSFTILSAVGKAFVGLPRAESISGRPMVR